MLEILSEEIFLVVHVLYKSSSNPISGEEKYVPEASSILRVIEIVGYKQLELDKFV